MSIGVDSLTSQFQQYLNTSSTAETEAATSKDYSSASDEELMDACKEFETYFIEQIYKGYQKMVNTDDDDTDAMSSMGSYYKEQLMQQYAEMTTEQGGFGLAQTLYEQMKRNYEV